MPDKCFRNHPGLGSKMNDLDKRQFCKIIVMKRASAATPPSGVNHSIVFEVTASQHNDNLQSQFS